MFCEVHYSTYYRKFIIIIYYSPTFLTFLSNWSRDRIDSSISVSSMEDVGEKACLSR